MTGTVLVVDDDRGMVETLCDVLELHGWRTERAFDGRTAVHVAAREQPDVVLMDVRMPKVDGVTALRQIKAQRPDAHVVLMTAYAAHDMLAQAREGGALRVLRKPVDVPELLALLDEARPPSRLVLVVDDDAEYLRTLCDVLQARGVTAVAARSLPEALGHVQRDAPTVVLLHLRLGGAQLATGAQALKRLDPSVLLAVYSGLPDALAAAVGGATPRLVDAAFTKPIRIDDLLEFLGVRSHP